MPPSSIQHAASTNEQERRATGASTLLVDRVMGYLIRAGGISIIVAVLGIFLFILMQILPLFRGASVQEYQTVQLPPPAAGEYLVLGLDEWGELPFVVDTSGAITFVDAAGSPALRAGRASASGSRTIKPLAADRSISSVAYNSSRQELLFGTHDGHFARVSITYSPQYQGETRAIDFDIAADPFIPIGDSGQPVVQVGYGDAGKWKIAVGKQIVDGGAHVHAVILTQKRSLAGAGAVAVHKSIDLTQHLEGTPRSLVVGAQGQSVVISTEEGDVIFFMRNEDQIELRQRFQPFADLADRSIASLDFLLGDMSLVMTNGSGENRVFSLFVPAGQSQRLFGLTKQFPQLPGPGGATFYSKSLRNKAFLIGSGARASLRFGTTEQVRWEEDLGFTIKRAALGGKYDRIALLDDSNSLHLFRLNDPHPESSFRAFFGKVWYEGATEPVYDWQSTGGTDDYEPKLSLVPLIIGTLKGTVYAMVFALPIALLAALYTSQFAHPKVRTIVKPTMEIMASLPSVVLGFLAALWLAPLVENKVPSLLLAFAAVPISALLFGVAWPRVPHHRRRWLRPGWEIALLACVMGAAAYIAWHVGPLLERVLFTVPDPETGGRIADFRLWWPHYLGLDFQQRNSLVVGFIMGFAVIPIIFTITEDSLSNVPGALRSGSLALGASRWQTAMWVVVPTASAGIFSAIMIGLGRAVGETMIVLMATGNTPIMDFNIFSGMRTLSANIAVELPEAPHHGTLYRALFLGAMLLFLMTFVVNTVAEVLRQHLRMKYRTA